MPDQGTLSFWTTLPYRVSPYLFQYNGFGIRYYSLMYILAFICVYFLLNYRMKTENFAIKPDHVNEFFVWAALGVLIGGRLGYVVFYNLSYFIGHPLEIFLPFKFDNGFSFTGISGMSYHGGLIGVAAAGHLYCRKQQINFWYFSDLICPAVPLGYTFGRIGNFLNAELYGRETSVPWAMIFPTDPEHALRHPSQLYEAFFEGLFLFAILWGLRKKKFMKKAMLGTYLIGYGCVRFFIEFFRMPDAHLNFVLYRFSLGQVLCALMITFGSLIIFISKTNKHFVNN